MSGAQVWIGAVLLRSSRRVCRLSGRKTERSFRLVMRRVLDAGVGFWSCGRLERSRLRAFFENLLDALEVRVVSCGLAADAVADAILTVFVYVGWIGRWLVGVVVEEERAWRIAARQRL